MHLDVRTNFEEKVSYVARRSSSMIVDEQTSFLSVDCSLPSDTFNVIVVRDTSASPQILACIDRFVGKDFPFAVWYWKRKGDQPAIATLNQYGLTHTETHSAMSVDLSQIQLAPVDVEGLEIRHVLTAQDLLQFAEVIAALFGDSHEGRQVLAYFQRLSSYPLSTFPAMRYYIGTFQGTVVAAGTLFVGSQTVGIYDVATRVEYRRRGIGSAMFQHLLNEARTTNHRFCVLQASQEGSGIYIKAGFNVTGEVLTFERKETFMQDESSVYHIRLKGHLSSHWATYFEGFTLMNSEHGDVLLSGVIADQAALHGILAKIRDLGLSLVSVNRIDSNLAASDADATPES